MGTIAELLAGAQVHIVDGGHFSLDTAAYEIAARVYGNTERISRRKNQSKEKKSWQLQR
jgi:hypothetical protein